MTDWRDTDLSVVPADLRDLIYEAARAHGYDDRSITDQIVRQYVAWALTEDDPPSSPPPRDLSIFTFVEFLLVSWWDG